MKNFTYAFIVILILANKFSFATKHPSVDGSVTILARSHNIFYFKICKNMVGGKVEVYDADGNLVRTQELNRCKFIVDFFDLPPGEYRVKVTKNCFEEVFDYHRHQHVSDKPDDNPDSIEREDPKKEEAVKKEETPIK